MPIAFTNNNGGVESNKSDKWKTMENPLKWLLNSTMHPVKQQNYSSNNYGTIMTKPTSSLHHGSSPPKKTDAPMLNLVYDSHIKQRYPDFR
jgi:hypothetical protein